MLRIDKESVSFFVEHMQQLFESAQSAASPSEMTILIGQDDAIRMIAGSDWPLDSLALDRGAKSAYRVIGSFDGTIRIEGREGSRRCVMESTTPAHTARLLLGC